MRLVDIGKDELVSLFVFVDTVRAKPQQELVLESCLYVDTRVSSYALCYTQLARGDWIRTGFGSSFYEV